MQEGFAEYTFVDAAVMVDRAKGEKITPICVQIEYADVVGGVLLFLSREVALDLAERLEEEASSV